MYVIQNVWIKSVWHDHLPFSLTIWMQDSPILGPPASFINIKPEPGGSGMNSPVNSLAYISSVQALGRVTYFREVHTWGKEDVEKLLSQLCWYLKTQLTKLTPECQDMPSAAEVPCAEELQNWNQHAMAASSRCLAAKRPKLRLLPSLQGLIFYPHIQKPLAAGPHASHIYMSMLIKFQNYVKGEPYTNNQLQRCLQITVRTYAGRATRQTARQLKRKRNRSSLDRGTGRLHGSHAIASMPGSLHWCSVSPHWCQTIASMPGSLHWCSVSPHWCQTIASMTSRLHWRGVCPHGCQTITSMPGSLHWRRMRPHWCQTIASMPGSLHWCSVSPHWCQTIASMTSRLHWRGVCPHGCQTITSMTSRLHWRRMRPHWCQTIASMPGSLHWCSVSPHWCQTIASMPGSLHWCSVCPHGCQTIASMTSRLHWRGVRPHGCQTIASMSRSFHWCFSGTLCSFMWFID